MGVEPKALTEDPSGPKDCISQARQFYPPLLCLDLGVWMPKVPILVASEFG